MYGCDACDTTDVLKSGNAKRIIELSGMGCVSILKGMPEVRFLEKRKADVHVCLIERIRAADDDRRAQVVVKLDNGITSHGGRFKLKKRGEHMLRGISIPECIIP